MQQRFRTGGLAAWSLHRPVSTLMIALSIIVLGVFSLDRLQINLLPDLIYPEIRVRIMNYAVPASIMEDRVTRQLEEQLAITEEATGIRTETSEGRSSVSLTFPYGTDINVALRDASNRLDRAKRFLPDSIEPPVIYKRDPMQIPIMEFAVSSTQRSNVELRDWVDYEFRNWFINLPGVASAEVGGGNVREFQVIIDQAKLVSYGLELGEVIQAIANNNEEIPGGTYATYKRELLVKTDARIHNAEQLAALPIRTLNINQRQSLVRLKDIARVNDTYEEEKLRIRLNGAPGVKLSIQKQPQANTVATADAVFERIAWMKKEHIIPGDISINIVDDQSVFVRYATWNAATAVVSGAILAMMIVYLFLGDLVRTLIIGSAIPLAIFAAFIIMDIQNITLNIMSLGGLAVGVGLLIDNTIVMLENITRHQHMEKNRFDAALTAVSEITSAVVASTSTNLAAILPFVFIGGLIGLLFNELIITLIAAMLSSLLVALTIVPSLSIYSRNDHSLHPSSLRIKIDHFIDRLAIYYHDRLESVFHHWKKIILVAIALLIASIIILLNYSNDFLPRVDEGVIRVTIRGDAGTQIEDMDHVTRQVEQAFREEKDVLSVFATSGGFVFGRFQRESSQYSSIKVVLKGKSQRNHSSHELIRNVQKKIRREKIAGFKIRMQVQGIRGLPKLSQGDDDVSLFIQGEEIARLGELGNKAVSLLNQLEILSNISHSYEDFNDELVIQVDRQRAAVLNISPGDIGDAVQASTTGKIISHVMENDREHAIRVKLKRIEQLSENEIRHIVVATRNRKPVYLYEIAGINFKQSPAKIIRDKQRRVVEISASINEGVSLNRAYDAISTKLAELDLPEGYTVYNDTAEQSLRTNTYDIYKLTALAIFLVFAVMAVQYESLRNPFIILLGIPFSLIGVVIGIILLLPTLTMPVWLGIIMLSGIVVNNAIVLVEQIEINRQSGKEIIEAIKTAARYRLRPILMTTLTTVFGMLPLAVGAGEGAEMLQPLAIVIVSGLTFSLLVSLVIIPVMYLLTHKSEILLR